jgi:hypothetical protein
MISAVRCYAGVIHVVADMRKPCMERSDLRSGFHRLKIGKMGGMRLLAESVDYDMFDYSPVFSDDAE